MLTLMLLIALNLKNQHMFCIFKQYNYKQRSVAKKTNTDTNSKV